MSSQKKYLIIPGWVFSKNDEDRHYINAQMLIRLYKVDPHECMIQHSDSRDLRRDVEGLIKLRPKTSGNYELPR
jgi:hypothetical protein